LRLLCKLFNLRGTADRKKDLKYLNSNKYYSYDDSSIQLELKEALCDSFKLENNEFKLFYHKVDFKILSKVFHDFKDTFCSNKEFEESLLNYVETKRFYFSLENLKNQLIKDFHLELNQCIEHCVYYHKNSFSNNLFYKKKYYQIIEKEERKVFYDLYSMAISEIEIGFNQITYNIENLNVNIYNYINLSFTINIKNSTRHKRNNHIQAKKELSRIKKIEKGESNRIYYPFYSNTKKELINYVNSKKYGFLLETKEINILVNCLVKYLPHKTKANKLLKEEFIEDMKLFFANDFNRINKAFFKERKIILNYLIYKLDKLEKCDAEIIFGQIKGGYISKYFQKKQYRFQKKKFKKMELENKKFPSKYKRIKNTINNLH